ncbi:MAG: glycosyltransferase family 2 protein [Actinomycetota bacterium]
MPGTLAVVVVNYNAGDYLARCIGSIYRSASDLELDVVVIDNASRDGSTDRAKIAYPTVRVLENPVNRGFAAAANQGIRATTAPYIFLLNPDAEITGGMLGAFVKLADDRPRAGAVGPLVRNPDGSVQPSARKVPGILESLVHAFVGPAWPNNPFTRSYTLSDWDRTTEREVEWLSGSAVLLRRAAVEEIGLYDEGFFMYVEDVDLCTRLRAAGWQVVFSPELEVTHVIGVSARGQTRRMAREHSRSIYRYFAKHARGPEALLRPFVRLALWFRALLAAREKR